MLQRKTIIWTAIAVAFIGGLIYFSFLREPEVEYVTESVDRGTLKETVSVSGTLKADETLSLDFEITGRIGSVEAEVGQKVSKGDIIGYLENENLQLAVDQAKANLNNARAEAGINEDTIHAANVEVDNAKKNLDDTESLNDANIAAAEQKVDDTEQYYEDAEEYYDQIVDDEGVNSAAAKLAKLTLDTAEANYEQAKDALEVADETADLAKTTAENKLETARASRDSAESEYVRATKNANIANYQVAYETALNNLGKAILRAPAAGVITDVNYEAGEVISASSESLANMISFDFILEARVPESDIAKIKVGQNADVTFDAFSSDEMFRAQAVSIEPSSTVVQDVVDYIAKLAMASEDERFKDGMSADIDILTAEKKNILIIPERAVTEKGGKYIVQVLDDGEPADRAVELGMEGDEGMIEAVSGLMEGEEVITSTRE